MSDPFIGEIRLLCFDYAPANWALCNGALMAVNAYPALFALIGNIYGGDGRTTFALPDFRGRIPISQGNDSTTGQALGTETVTLTSAQIPSHTHSITAYIQNDDTKRVAAPASNIYIGSPKKNGAFGTGTGNTTLAAQTLSTAGQSAAHENRQPYLTLNFCIALQGQYPLFS